MSFATAITTRTGGIIEVSHVNSIKTALINAFDSGAQIANLDTTARDAVSTPATGQLIFNTTTAQFEFYDGSNWVSLLSVGAQTVRTTATVTTTLSMGSTYQNEVIDINGNGGAQTLTTVAAGGFDMKTIRIYGGANAVTLPQSVSNVDIDGDVILDSGQVFQMTYNLGNTTWVEDFRKR